MEEQNTPTNDRLTDKAFSRFLVTSILSILACIVCLCSTTYAWFSDNAPSNSNKIQTATECLLEVSVIRANDMVEFTDVDKGIILSPDEEYQVTLSLPASSSSGYCLISAGAAEYYTDYILRHDEELPKTVTFTLTVAEATNVTFTPRWGIYSGESSVIEGILNIQ